MTASVATVIVSFNTRETLRRCLEHLQPEIYPTHAQVVVVDNASADGSAAMVRKAFPWVRVIANDRNRGFGAACNQGIAATRSDFILLLNSDCFLAPGAINELSGYVLEHERVAAAGPRLTNADGSLQWSGRRFPTPLRVLLGTGSLDEQAYSHSGPMDYVSGACLLLRRAAFDDVGGFDEAYFFYAEEMDLAYRLWKRGWQVHYTVRAQATHLGGASTQQHTGHNLWFEPYFAGQARFFHKHYGTLALLAWQAAMILAYGRGLVRRTRHSLALIRLTLSATWHELGRGAPVAR